MLELYFRFVGWGVSKIKIKLFQCVESSVFGMLHYSLYLVACVPAHPPFKGKGNKEIVGITQTTFFSFDGTWAGTQAIYLGFR